MGKSPLRGLSLFAGVEPAQLAELERAAEARSLARDEVVFAPGDPCDGIYVVVSGEVAIRTHMPDMGRGAGPVEVSEPVRQMGPGELFGEIEVLDGSRRVYEARTLRPVRLLRIPQERLWSFLRRQPAVEARLRTLAIYRRTTELRGLLAPADRRDPRIRVDCAVRLRLVGAGWVSARLEDLSYGGACLSSAPDSFRPGEVVGFVLGTEEAPALLEVRARVRWRMQDVIGLVFEGDIEAPAHRRQVDLACRRLLGR
jgi:CRP-like cAMP-binding protein